jgi:SHS2 domain-containing protein
LAYRFLDHTADLGIEVRAVALPELFVEALRGLTDSMVDLQRVSASVSRDVELESLDLESLFVDWLNEVIVWYETEGLVLSDARIRLEEADSGWRLTGSVRGESYDPEWHGLKTLIKAVTYHQLSIEHRPEGWRASFILDL